MGFEILVGCSVKNGLLIIMGPHCTNFIAGFHAKMHLFYRGNKEEKRQKYLDMKGGGVVETTQYFDRNKLLNFTGAIVF